MADKLISRRNFLKIATVGAGTLAIKHFLPEIDASRSHILLPNALDKETIGQEAIPVFKNNDSTKYSLTFFDRTVKLNQLIKTNEDALVKGFQWIKGEQNGKETAIFQLGNNEYIFLFHSPDKGTSRTFTMTTKEPTSYDVLDENCMFWEPNYYFYWDGKNISKVPDPDLSANQKISLPQEAYDFFTKNVVDNRIIDTIEGSGGTAIIRLWEDEKFVVISNAVKNYLFPAMAFVDSRLFYLEDSIKDPVKLKTVDKYFIKTAFDIKDWETAKRIRENPHTSVSFTTDENKIKALLELVSQYAGTGKPLAVASVILETDKYFFSCPWLIIEKGGFGAISVHEEKVSDKIKIYLQNYKNNRSDFNEVSG